MSLPASPRPDHARDLLDPGAPPDHVTGPPHGLTPEQRATLTLDAPATPEVHPHRAARRRGRGRGGGRGPRGVQPRPGEIPGLDGLRALAILGVLLFHYWPGTLPGGFLGVDVFFVVSGFLITTLLLRELDRTGRLDLPSFWRRRARRLLPALLLVVLVSVSAARLIGGDLLVGIGRQTAGALTFTSNWVEIAAGASYFQSTSPILFVNVWSLAVEEQFYLLWPLTLVVVLAVTRTTRQRVIGVALVGLASALLMALLYTPGDDATRVYYGTDTHLVGLMGGAALALAWADPRRRAGLRTATWRVARPWAVLLALLTLAALMRWGGEDSPLTFRGGIALASVATVVLVAGLLEAPSLWRRVMSTRPLTWLGRRSYGIYLWHWPVLVLAGAVVPYAVGTARATGVLLTSLGLTLVLSELSLRLVELPVRRHGIRATVRALGTWIRTPWQVSRTPRLLGAGLLVLLVGTVLALATAPEKSATQRQIEESEARIAGADGTADDELVDPARDQLASGTILGRGGADPGEAAPAPSPQSVQLRGSTFTRDEDDLLVPAGPEMTAIGDSLVVTSADGLTYRFPGITYLAQSNRRWSDAQEVVATGLSADAVRGNVVLHLGTNAGVDEEALRATLDALGPERNIVVMDLSLQAPFTEESNATIRAVVEDYPQAVVGEWNATIGEQPEVLQSDRVHPDLEGMHVYAEVVAEAFDELARRG